MSKTTNKFSSEVRDRAVRLPARRDDTFKKAAREEDRTAQGKLDF